MGHRFELEHVVIPSAGAVLAILIVLYLVRPELLLLPPALLLIVGIMTRNRRCHEKQIDKFFTGFYIGGHRGAPHNFPENSIAGFEQAKRDGADLVEFDVSMTKDGVAVLLHDDDLDRTTNMTGPIRERYYAEIATANISAKFVRSRKYGPHTDIYPEYIPTLEAAVQWATTNKVRMLFDIKDSDTELINIIVATFAKYDLYENSIVCSFFPWVTYRIKQADARILTGQTWRPGFFHYHDMEYQRPRFTGLKQLLMGLVDAVYGSMLVPIVYWYLGAEMLLMNHVTLSEGFVDEQRANGLRVCGWTVNDVGEMHWMLETLGVPLLTDYPECSNNAKFLSSLRSAGYEVPTVKVKQHEMS